jgi:glucokinase
MQDDQDHAEVVLSLDIGGTAIKSALFADGKMQCRLPQVPSNSNGTAEQIGEAIRTAVSNAGKYDRIAVSIPGPFDYHNGIFYMQHKFAAVNGCSFADLTGCQDAVFVHDANAFLLGELAYGAARGAHRAGGITLGTGLGAAFAVDGKLLTCDTGSPACDVSIWNVHFRGGIAEDFVSSRWLQAQDSSAESVKAIADKARAGDECVRSIWRDYGHALFELLTDWSARLHPDCIVIGGQIARDIDLFGAVPAGLPICRAQLDGDGALYGAYVACQNLECRD